MGIVVKKLKNGFVVTMAFNEKEALQVWYRHYSQYFDPESMYVIDHGSNENYVPDGVNRIYVPRYKGFNEDCRRDAVQGLVHSLNQYYDFGIYCDADELVLLDSFSYDELGSGGITFVHGFNIFRVSVDGKDRIYGLLSHGMCKPIVFRTMTPCWSSGFHGVRLDTTPSMSLIMAHTKFYDVNIYQRNISNRHIAYDEMHEHHKNFGINSHWVDPNVLHNVYGQVQSAIDQNCLRNDISEYTPLWGHDPNGFLVAKDTGSPFLLDLTDKFAHLL